MYNKTSWFNAPADAMVAYDSGLERQTVLQPPDTGEQGRQDDKDQKNCRSNRIINPLYRPFIDGEQRSSGADSTGV